MSGDLENPSRSLVHGTFWALGTGFLVYLAQILLVGGSQARVDLIARPYEMLMHNALLGASFLVIAGVFSATISSALGSFMGAPRVLQAVARDQILPVLGPLGRGSKARDEPRLALGLTLVLSLLVVVLASDPRRDSKAAFDLIASLVSMVFLCTYGMINLAAFVESFGRNPSFRPRFRLFHWSLSLGGFLGCFVAMLMIDPLAAAVAVAVIGALYLIIAKRSFRSTFGDARRGFFFALAIRSLQRLRGMKADPRNWRPTILVIAGSTAAHLTQIRYADWLEGGSGLVTAAQVVLGDLQTGQERCAAARAELERFVREHELSVFPEVVLSRDLDEGLRVLVQAHSIGPLKANTVVFGWPRSPERAAPFFRHLADCGRLGKSVLAVVDRGLPDPEKDQRRIDIWWRGQANGSLMLILAYLLTQNMPWRHARLRILRVTARPEERAAAQAELEGLIQASRVEAEALTLVSDQGFAGVLKQHSADADLVFLGLDLAPESEAECSCQRCILTVEGLPTTLLVHSSGEADLRM
jgi:hypothetical protein